MDVRLGIVLTGTFLMVAPVFGQEQSQRNTAVVQRESADEILRAGWADKWKIELETNASSWEAWGNDLQGALKVSEEYAAAARAVEEYRNEMKGVFFDEEEYAALVAARDDRYRTVALAVYEKHFGAWEGDLAEFDVLLELADESNLEKCARVARETCGESGVKSVKVTSDSCEFTCKDNQ